MSTDAPIEQPAEPRDGASDAAGTASDRPQRDHGSTAVPQVPSPPTVRVEGLSETLRDVRHELTLIAHAAKFEWINKRLILLRNGIIAFSVLTVCIMAVVVCYREAYRQTLTIASFDVPERLVAHGITGQVVAKALFDELIKRREVVTTLDAGEIRGAWADNRADVAIPEAKFTLQSLFRYLRYMTGREIAVDGEIIVDGDDALMKVRVAGSAPTVVRGKIAQWDTLIAELANGVLDVTQPAVLAAYMGVKASTPADVTALSKYLQKMLAAPKKPNDQVMSVAYDAYGSALARLNRADEALLALNEAMRLDPHNGVAVVNAAGVLFLLRQYDRSSALFKQSQAMTVPDVVKARGLRARVSAASNRGDCPTAASALSDAKASLHYDARSFVTVEAIYLARCEYEEARAVEMVKKYAQLHPDSQRENNALGIIQQYRPEGRYLNDAILTYRKAIAAGVTDSYVFANLAISLGRVGDHAASADAMRVASEEFRHYDADHDDLNLGRTYWLKKEFGKADALLTPIYRKRLSEVEIIRAFAGTRAGLGKYSDAIAAYSDGLASFPKSCLLWDDFGRMYADKGDVEAALATFDKGINAVPKCGLCYNSAARLLISKNRVPEAKRKLDALIAAAPQSDGAVIARELLAGR
jgi:tetratricopeptide (TPR) repeat protein